MAGEEGGEEGAATLQLNATLLASTSIVEIPPNIIARAVALLGQANSHLFDWQALATVLGGISLAASLEEACSQTKWRRQSGGRSRAASKGFTANRGWRRAGWPPGHQPGRSHPKLGGTGIAPRGESASSWIGKVLFIVVCASNRS